MNYFPSEHTNGVGEEERRVGGEEGKERQTAAVPGKINKSTIKEKHEL